MNLMNNNQFTFKSPELVTIVYVSNVLSQLEVIGNDFSCPISVTNHRSLLANSTCYKKVFIIRGIGYRANLIENVSIPSYEFLQKRYLVIRVGHSYSFYIPIPQYIGIKILKKDRKLIIYGPSSKLVSNFSKRCYLLRQPSVYTGRGIRYKGEVTRRKLGKKDIRKGRFF